MKVVNVSTSPLTIPRLTCAKIDINSAHKREDNATENVISLLLDFEFFQVLLQFLLLITNLVDKRCVSTAKTHNLENGATYETTYQLMKLLVHRLSKKLFHYLDHVVT